MMSSPLKKQPEAVADKVLKRVEVSKIARRLQGRLALAQFKTKHGWEDLTLDTLEPKIEEEIRRKRQYEADMLSDSSSTTSELPYPNSRALMSSPLKAPLFSDAVGPSSGSTSGHRKRTYMASFDMPMSSPTKRQRSSPTTHKSFNHNHSHNHTHTHHHNANQNQWRSHRQLAQSSPVKPRRQQHFTTSTGPDVSFFQGARRPSMDFASHNFAAHLEEDEDLPVHSFRVDHNRASPPRTPPMRNRTVPNRRNKDRLATNGQKSGEEGADLLLYLAASPSPAVPSTKTRMEPPSTPPMKKDLALPSSMMTTPGGGNLFPTTPGQPFDISDFVNITPSPAQKPWKTPVSLTTAKTPLGLARRKLTFEEPLH
ncbi:hypothetical protein SLS62_005870 [Diatrype stigma]|uniref:Cyclin-dependent kinase n=1 Tax=Diatrype stigma TaxID=117547 RepID=A0AAN9UQC8_9PEZI